MSSKRDGFFQRCTGCRPQVHPTRESLGRLPVVSVEASNSIGSPRVTIVALALGVTAGTFDNSLGDIVIWIVQVIPGSD